MRPQDLLNMPPPVPDPGPPDPSILRRQSREERMQRMQGLIDNFTFSLGSGLTASAEARGGARNKTYAGVGAALQAPAFLEKARQEFALKQQQEAARAEEMRQRLAQDAAQLEQQKVRDTETASQNLETNYRLSHPPAPPPVLPLPSDVEDQRTRMALAAQRPPAPRNPVPGTDVPLPAAVAAQRIAIANATKTPPQPREGPAPQQIRYTDEQGVERLGVIDTSTGQIRPAVTPTGKEAKPTVTSATKATLSERKALGFYERVSNAKDALDAMESDIGQMGLAAQAQLTYAPNVLQTAVGKRYTQAANDFINATLRRESGAAISDKEYERFNKIYFPRPGDDAATLAQKKKARDVQLGSFQTEAGRAFKEKYGEDPDALPAPVIPKGATIVPGASNAVIEWKRGVGVIPNNP